MLNKRLLSLVPKAVVHCKLTVLYQIVALVGSIGYTWGFCQLVASFLGSSALPLQGALLVSIASVLLRVYATVLSGKESFKASQEVKLTARHLLYEKLLRIGPNYSNSITASEVTQLAVEGCEQLESYFGLFVPQFFYAIIAPVILFFVVAPLNLIAAIILLLCVPLIPVVIVLVRKLARKTLGRYWNRYANLGHSFLENLEGLTTLKIYQADEARHKAMNTEAENFRVATMRVLAVQLNSIIVMDFVALGGAAVGIGVALLLAHTGLASAMQCLFIALIAAEFFIPMRQFGSYFHIAMNGVAASDKIFAVLELPEPAEKPLSCEVGDHFYIHDLSFSYPTRDKNTEQEKGTEQEKRTEQEKGTEQKKEHRASRSSSTSCTLARQS